MTNFSQISRLAKILVEKEGITFPEAEERLKALTLEIVVGPSATSAAAHAAVLTVANLGHRTFIGGVRVTGELNQPSKSALPLPGRTLGEVVRSIGASEFDGPALFRVLIGADASAGDGQSISLWWQGWRAGAVVAGQLPSDAGDNTLVGIAAAALGVGTAFFKACGSACEDRPEINLWSEEQGPGFEEVFLPAGLWLVGVGNLGQAYLWALASLPYRQPSDVELVLQDRDQVSEENWGTSVLVFGDIYGDLKTKVGERWAEAKGFKVRRVDRWLVETDRLQYDDPRVALSGLDRFAPRIAMGQLGFDCIVDAGLGRTAKDFDGLRLSVFDESRSITEYFASFVDELPDEKVQESDAYKELAGRIGPCGMAEIAGASAAVPFVSALASALAISRLIELASGQNIAATEICRISKISSVRKSPSVASAARGIKHAGRAA